jgi:cytochrome c oxidase subunit 2
MLLFKMIYCDAAESWQIGFQDSASPIHTGIVNLHDDIMFYLIVILIGVLWMMFSIMYYFLNQKFVHKYLRHGTLIEIIWTVAPALVLIAIAFPSFQLLYFMDEVIDPKITVKAIGHQWYWTYEFSDYLDGKEVVVAFDSYMVPTDDLQLGDLRLLEVDNRLKLPVNTHIRVLLTAADVLHAWSVPSLGVKLDCVPGRLNQTSLYINRYGTFYGQCSELCGVQHGFMPIVVEGVSLSDYVVWLTEHISGE